MDTPYFVTALGRMLHGDSLELLRSLPEASAQAVITSPPFALRVPKAYGNPTEAAYLDWFAPFLDAMHRVLRPEGSLVLEIGGGWLPGLPSRSLYPYRVLLYCCEALGMHLAQEFTWWNPATMAGNYWSVRARERFKEGARTIWWLGKGPRPLARLDRVLWPYREGMRRLLRQNSRGRRGRRSPGGHDNSHFRRDNGGAIPPNLLALAHEGGNSPYLRACREHGVAPHPARFPEALPAFFIKLTTDPGDLVLDPFAGSCATGHAADRLGRRWLCLEREAAYLEGGRLRFQAPPAGPGTRRVYEAFHPEAGERGGWGA